MPLTKDQIAAELEVCESRHIDNLDRIGDLDRATIHRWEELMPVALRQLAEAMETIEHIRWIIKHRKKLPDDASWEQIAMEFGTALDLIFHVKGLRVATPISFPKPEEPTP